MKTSNRRKFLKAVSVAGLFLPLTNYASTLGTSNDGNEAIPPRTGGLLTDYLAELKTELLKAWPTNRTVNLVFHGHSVPSGYFKTPAVNTISAYPHLVLATLKTLYPTAVINCITTAVGGENARQGARRFHQVLRHSPDVVFIDYALNDRAIGLEAAKKAWSQMIKKAVQNNIKVILLTPSPDLHEDIENNDSLLKKHCDQIEALAKEFEVGLANSYQAFQAIAAKKEDLSPYMAQFNHPNEKGHQVIADSLIRYFH